MFKRHLELAKARRKLEKKLIEGDTPPEAAEKFVNEMSAAGIPQVQKDLERTTVVVIDEYTGKIHHFSKNDFSNDEKTELFLSWLSEDDEKLKDYLTKYLHQGGFLHLAELLMANYFTPDIRLETTHLGIFTKRKDGTLTFEEQFDIPKIKTAEGEFETANKTSIATVRLKSTLSKTANNDIMHQYHDIKIEARDTLANKLFHAPQGKFEKFKSWLKDTLLTISGQSPKEEKSGSKRRL